MERTRHPGIYKRGGRYVIVWRHRGKQHREAFGTLAEAREAKGRRQSVDRLPVPKIAFGDYFEAWIESYAGRTARGFSETTRPEYERPIRAHALERWGAWKLADVGPADVRELFGEMRRDGCSTSQIRKTRAALSAMFATAVDDNKLPSNPVQGVRIPAAPDDGQPVEERAKALTRAELKILLAAIPEDWRLFFEFLVHTGLRISEAIGLRWEHLDLGENPKVRVREQVYRGKRRKLKSGAGRRDLPLSPRIREGLLAHRRSAYRGPKTPVFASTVGTELIRGKVAERVLTPAAIAVGFKTEELIEGEDGEQEMKVRPTVTFHTFRHTCASLLFDAGRNIKQVQEWLGHSDPAFTLRTYIHLIDAGLGTGIDFLAEGGEAQGGDNGVTTRHPETAAKRGPVGVRETAD